jgi:hypothetical protein
VASIGLREPGYDKYPKGSLTGRGKEKEKEKVRTNENKR